MINPFVEIDDPQLKLATRLLGDDYRLLGVDDPAEGARLALCWSQACDMACGSDELYVASAFLHLRAWGLSDRVLMALDGLRRARRTKH
jgi:hypothetical protein